MYGHNEKVSGNLTAWYWILIIATLGFHSVGRAQDSTTVDNSDAGNNPPVRVSSLPVFPGWTGKISQSVELNSFRIDSTLTDDQRARMAQIRAHSWRQMDAAVLWWRSQPLSVRRTGNRLSDSLRVLLGAQKADMLAILTDDQRSQYEANESRVKTIPGLIPLGHRPEPPVFDTTNRSLRQAPTGSSARQ